MSDLLKFLFEGLAVREITPEQIARIRGGAAHYVENAERHRRGLKKLD